MTWAELTIREAVAALRRGGPERYHARNREQGKLFCRQRLELLLDPGFFLEDGLFANCLAEEPPADGHDRRPALQPRPHNRVNNDGEGEEDTGIDEQVGRGKEGVPGQVDVPGDIPVNPGEPEKTSQDQPGDYRPAAVKEDLRKRASYGQPTCRLHG